MTKPSRPFWKTKAEPKSRMARLQELRQQFNQACYEYGDVQYKIEIGEKRLIELTQKRKELSLEFDKLEAEQRSFEAAEDAKKATAAADAASLPTAPPAPDATPEANAA